MSIDHRLSTEKITPELIDYIVEKIVQAVQPEKIILFWKVGMGRIQESCGCERNY